MSIRTSQKPAIRNSQRGAPPARRRNGSCFLDVRNGPGKMVNPRMTPTLYFSSGLVNVPLRAPRKCCPFAISLRGFSVKCPEPAPGPAPAAPVGSGCEALLAIATVRRSAASGLHFRKHISAIFRGFIWRTTFIRIGRLNRSNIRAASFRLHVFIHGHQTGDLVLFLFLFLFDGRFDPLFQFLQLIDTLSECVLRWPSTAFHADPAALPAVAGTLCRLPRLSSTARSAAEPPISRLSGRTGWSGSSPGRRRRRRHGVILPLAISHFRRVHGLLITAPAVVSCATAPLMEISPLSGPSVRPSSFRASSALAETPSNGSSLTFMQQHRCVYETVPAVPWPPQLRCEYPTYGCSAAAVRAQRRWRPARNLPPQARGIAVPAKAAPHTRVCRGAGVPLLATQTRAASAIWDILVKTFSPSPSWPARL